MATAKFFDNYASTLSGSYTSGGTSLSITGAGSGASALPATAGDYYLVVDPGTGSEEVFKVTARSTLTLTVVGAQAGTSAANHSSGAIIKGPIWTADGITQLRADITADNATDTAWVQPTLLNSWVYIGGGNYNQAEYMRDRTGRVWMRGMVKNGTVTAGTVVFTLPSGFRPPAWVYIGIINAGGSGLASIIIKPSGDVEIADNGNAGFMSLEASFSTTV